MFTRPTAADYEYHILATVEGHSTYVYCDDLVGG
jgi:hypothetical protein